MVSGAAYLFDVQPFDADVTRLSVASGGTQQLQLDAGHLHAGAPYFVLGSMTGIAPGIDLPGGVHLPLVPDDFFVRTLVAAGGRPLPGGAGVLYANGSASSGFVLPPGAGAALAGLFVYHAAVVLDASGQQVVLASNPVALALTD